MSRPSHVLCLLCIWHPVSACIISGGINVELYIAFKPPELLALHGFAMQQGDVTAINSSLTDADDPIFATLAPMYSPSGQFLGVRRHACPLREPTLAPCA